MKNSLDQLWGAQISAVDISADLSEIALDILVVDSASQPGERAHRLELSGVNAVHFDRSAPLPWNYCELTSITARATLGGIEVVAELWDSQNLLRCVCSGIKLNGRPVTVGHAV